jgi:hypothetical protein
LRNDDQKKKKTILFLLQQKTCFDFAFSIEMTSAESPALGIPDGLPDGAALLCTDKLDLTTSRGLRQLQRNFILEEPRYSSLLF